MNWDSSQKMNKYLYLLLQTLLCVYFAFCASLDTFYSWPKTLRLFFMLEFMQSRNIPGNIEWKISFEGKGWGFSAKWNSTVKSGLCDVLRPLLYLTCVCQVLDQTVVVSRELSHKAKLLIFQSMYVSTFTYGHELWGGDRKKLRLQKWVAEMNFLCRRSLSRWGEELGHPEGVDLLLPHIERNQLRCLPPGCFPLGVFWACPTDKDNLTRPRIPQKELENIAGERVVWNSLLPL